MSKEIKTELRFACIRGLPSVEITTQGTRESTVILRLTRVSDPVPASAVGHIERERESEVSKRLAKHPAQVRHDEVFAELTGAKKRSSFHHSQTLAPLLAQRETVAKERRVGWAGELAALGQRIREAEKEQERLDDEVKILEGESASAAAAAKIAAAEIRDAVTREISGRYNGTEEAARQRLLTAISGPLEEMLRARRDAKAAFSRLENATCRIEDLQQRIAAFHTANGR
jgi:hypothetical protein